MHVGCRREPPPPAHVYVPDATTVGGEAAVFRDLDMGRAPRPEHSEIIRSAGAAGLLMRFSRPAMIPDVLHALDSAASMGLAGRSDQLLTWHDAKCDNDVSLVMAGIDCAVIEHIKGTGLN